MEQGILHNIEFMGYEQGPSGLPEMSGIPEILLKCATANNSGFFPHGLDLEKDQSLRRRKTNQS